MYNGTDSNVYIQMGKMHSASQRGQRVGASTGGRRLGAVSRLLMLFSWHVAHTARYRVPRTWN